MTVVMKKKILIHLQEERDTSTPSHPQGQGLNVVHLDINLDLQILIDPGQDPDHHIVELSITTLQDIEGKGTNPQIIKIQELLVMRLLEADIDQEVNLDHQNIDINDIILQKYRMKSLKALTGIDQKVDPNHQYITDTTHQKHHVILINRNTKMKNLQKQIKVLKNLLRL